MPGRPADFAAASGGPEADIGMAIEGISGAPYAS